MVCDKKHKIFMRKLLPRVHWRFDIGFTPLLPFTLHGNTIPMIWD